MDGPTWQQAAVLAGITLAVFSSTLAADFVYDARMQILSGDFIHDWRNWPAVLTGRVLAMDVLDFNRPAMLASPAHFLLIRPANRMANRFVLELMSSR
jgi:hypothetical protein